jgi:hypothetical protein
MTMLALELCPSFSQYLRTGMYATTGLKPQEDYRVVDVIGGHCNAVVRILLSNKIGRFCLDFEPCVSLMSSRRKPVH